MKKEAEAPEATEAEPQSHRYSVSAYVTVANDQGEQRSRKVVTFTTQEPGDSGSAVRTVLETLGALTDEQRGAITRIDIRAVDPDAEVTFNFPASPSAS